MEAGQATSGQPAPLIARSDFPPDWRIVLAIPSSLVGLHGDRERQAFQVLRAQSPSLAETDALCRLVVLGMLPALAERNFDAFSEAVYDFNRRVGERFAAVQGAPYAHPTLAELVAFLRQAGIRGVGQSSWGAGIFAIVSDDEAANAVAARVRERFGLAAAEVIVTRAHNEGALCTP